MPHLRILPPGAILLLLACAAPAAEGPKPIDVPLRPLQAFWARDKGTGTAVADPQTPRDNRPSTRIDHTGLHDWSLTTGDSVPVKPGDLLELSVWARVAPEHAGEAWVGAMAYAADRKPIDYALGRKSLGKAGPVGDWRLVKTRLVVPPTAATIVPRVFGQGVSRLWVQDLKLARLGTLDALRNPDLPPTVSASAGPLTLTFDTRRATFDVQDARTRRRWTQAVGTAELIVTGAKTVPGGLDVDLYSGAGAYPLKAAVRLDAARAEVSIVLSGDPSADLGTELSWPAPFVTAAADKGMYVVLPMNEGISYPVDDTTAPLHKLICYGGHGICMAFYGVTDGAAGQMTLIETPDDASVQLVRLDGRLAIKPIWQGQKAKFGYDRKLRLCFFETGGHVAMAKRYRAHAKETGLLKTLAEKRKEVPAVDRLVGAVNTWCWDKDAVRMVKEMQAAGIERILWSAAASGEVIKQLNDLSVLTSRYDIYQDSMNPAEFPKLRGKHADWTSEAWAAGDIMRGPSGDWIRGWQVTAKDGSMIPCGVLCDLKAPDYARKRIPEDLKTHPYLCRFIDTTTASPWRECYDPNHPCTRTQSRQAKMELLAVVSKEYKLVTGCETGHDASVPYLHYFEGMLSLGPYRVPDSGRRMQVILDDVPDRVRKYQVGHAFRLPLWELVYHDCVVAQWYWGDYNNKLPAIWTQRDLFNALYATPGMFMFDRKNWDQNKARFAQSYKTWASIVRDAGYAEMTDHRFLTPDRSVQQTKFANGLTVTVNFGDQPYQAEGLTLAPLSVHRR